jgi:flagellar basal-body rod modification protein FlgD
MAAATIENWNQLPSNLTEGRIAPMSTNSSGQGDVSGSSSASITANDFLTLLVTEMKNQDPTANTDPNQYINQLVQVNSLQQLISINDTLTNSFGVSTKTEAAVHSGSSGTQIKLTAEDAPRTSSMVDAARADVARATVAGGNLSLPAANPAALGLASALSHK